MGAEESSATMCISCSPGAIEPISIKIQEARVFDLLSVVVVCIDNENDALGLPEQEPICTEEQVAETGQSGQAAHTPGNTGQVAHTLGQSGQDTPGQNRTNVRTGQEPPSRTTDLRTGQRTNQERRVTRSHRLSEHTALAAHSASAANPPDSDAR